eukprot:SAG31_NODE_752_length_12351_cov_14.467516_10_plen_224_part_00
MELPSKRRSTNRQPMPKMTMIAKLDPKAPPLDLCSDSLNTPNLQAQAKEATKIFRQLAATGDSYGTVESDPYHFHYAIAQSCCFMTLADKSFPNQVAFAYLDELKKEFLGVYGNQIASTTRPYAFMKFEKFMKETKKTFTENKSQHSLDLLGAELKDVRRIMTRNIQDVLERGDKLQRSADESRRLVEDSAIYKKRAQDLNKCLWLRQNAPCLFVSAIVRLRY